MSISDREVPLPSPPAPPADGMSWAWLADQMRFYGQNFHPPQHLRGLSLAHVEAKAREEERVARAIREARESAARIAAAPRSIERALLDGPPPASKAAAAPAQRGWRLRVRYLNQLRRCRSFREAAARVGVDESTVRRWRKKFPAFGARCDEIVAERFRQNADDLRLRAGEPRTRPYFFKGKQIGEQVIPDDRALMFLLKLEDAQRARAEARAERREQREHELRMKQLELSKMHAPAAHPVVRGEAQSSSESNDLKAVAADIPPPEVVEVPLTPSGAPRHLVSLECCRMPVAGGSVAADPPAPAGEPA